jgi:hypothetical protein
MKSDPAIATAEIDLTSQISKGEHLTMRIFSLAASFSLLFISYLGPASAQSAQSCKTTTITVNATGGNVAPLGINSADTVVGTFADSGFANHGFIWANGNGRLYDFPGAVGTQLSGINNAGISVGTLTNSDGSSHGFTLDKNGRTRQFSVPGFFSTVAIGINNHGVIVGVAQPVRGPDSGFEKIGNTFKTIQFPGAVNTTPLSINDAGVIVGQYFDGNSTHSFVLANGKYVTFAWPGTSSTQARGINNAGEIVGEFRQTANSQGQGFTFKDRKFAAFKYPGATFTELSGVNALGDRVGDAVTSSNNGFLSGPGFLLKCR